MSSLARLLPCYRTLSIYLCVYYSHFEHCSITIALKWTLSVNSYINKSIKCSITVSASFDFCFLLQRRTKGLIAIINTFTEGIIWCSKVPPKGKLFTYMGSYIVFVESGIINQHGLYVVTHLKLVFV